VNKHRSVRRLGEDTLVLSSYLRGKAQQIVPRLVGITDGAEALANIAVAEIVDERRGDDRRIANDDAFIVSNKVLFGRSAGEERGTRGILGGKSAAEWTAAAWRPG